MTLETQKIILDETLPSPSPSTEILDLQTYENSQLPRLRELVYAIYTTDKTPRTIQNARQDERHQPLTTCLLEHRQEPFVRELPLNLLPYAVEFQSFSHTNGFFNIETTQWPSQKIEAEQLFDWPEWQRIDGKTIAYLSDFTPHLQLTHQEKVQTLQSLFQVCYQLFQNDIHPDLACIVLAPNVKQFVEETGSLKLTATDAPYKETPLLTTLRQTFPGYWLNNPQLYTLEFR